MIKYKANTILNRIIISISVSMLICKYTQHFLGGGRCSAGKINETRGGRQRAAPCRPPPIARYIIVYVYRYRYRYRVILCCTRCTQTSNNN